MVVNDLSVLRNPLCGSLCQQQRSRSRLNNNRENRLYNNDILFLFQRKEDSNKQIYKGKKAKWTRGSGKNYRSKFRSKQKQGLRDRMNADIKTYKERRRKKERRKGKELEESKKELK